MSVSLCVCVCPTMFPHVPNGFGMFRHVSAAFQDGLEIVKKVRYNKATGNAWHREHREL